MRKPSTAHLVYNTLFPRPRSSDPSSFAAHITRNLVPEVRVETSTFYGHLDCIEAQYPGLDYSYGPHRLRLGRFPWHRRLFRAFDALGLTDQEISELCCWEGTKSARQRYEADEGITVQDTTGDSIPLAIPDPLPMVEIHYDYCRSDDGLDLITDNRSDDTVRASDSRSSSVSLDYHVLNDEFEDEYSDEEVESCGLDLNNRLMAAMAARDRGADVPLDEDWEKWLKEAAEQGGYAEVTNAIRLDHTLRLLPEPVSLSSRRESSRRATPATQSAEAYLLSTSPTLFPTSPVFPPTSSHTSSAAR